MLQAEGEVVRRAPETVNPEIADRRGRGAGRPSSRSLSRSTPLPFQLDEENVDETLRLRYRWLDLRRDKLQRNIRLRGADGRDDPARDGGRRASSTSRRRSSGSRRPRARATSSCRRACSPARFYALPQSPQIAKQLLVIAGFERYYQIAICFRDEDLRADRVQEITQLDVEMAFPDQEFLFALMERMMSDGLARVRRRRARDAVPAA